jgi:hypothetical protein
MHTIFAFKCLELQACEQWSGAHRDQSVLAHQGFQHLTVVTRLLLPQLPRNSLTFSAR